MRKISAAALLVMATLASPAVAGRLNKVLSIGDSAPAFKDIVGTDDKPHSLDEYKDAKVVAVVFTCNHCPVAQQYEQRLIDLQRDYQDKGVQIVAICVNPGEEDNLAHMKNRVKASSYNFPYLSDPSQAAGRKYGAQKTPEVFVLDAKRKIVYMGAIDDSWMDPQEVKKPYLRNAIDATLEGRMLDPKVQEMKATGCGIEYNP